MIWVAYLTAIGYGMDTAVWINIDETPIPYHYGNRHGWKTKKPSDTMKQSMVERASLQLQRSHCTLLANIASSTDVQNVLPQILLPKIQGRKKKWKAVSTLETRPENVETIMDTNGWNGYENFETVFTKTSNSNGICRSKQSGAGDGLPSKSLCLENPCFIKAMEMESVIDSQQTHRTSATA